MPRKMTAPRKVDTFPLDELAARWALEPNQIGLIIVDHGSRRDESNEMLLQLVAEFKHHSPFEIVEPAHMELAKPSIEDAFDRCVAVGMKLIVVHPYFLFPGRHWHEDIPRLAAAAAAKHDHVEHLITAPLGIHPLMTDIIHTRIEEGMRQKPAKHIS